MERNVVLHGELVDLVEIQPEHFQYVIDWRNNPENNKYLNQFFTLTMELQEKWYEKYKNDMSQGMFIMIDKEKGIPFGTFGYTDYLPEEKICILGRLLVGNYDYRSTPHLLEGTLLISDFIHGEMGVEKCYIHVVNENKKAASYDKRFGFKPNKGTIRFPKELNVQGLMQTEYVRSSEEYLHAINKIKDILSTVKNLE